MGKPEKRIKQGDLAPFSAAVLAAVIEKPSHGYEIARRLTMRTGTERSLRSVYGALERLEKDGLLRSKPEQARVRSGWRRTYWPTELGEQVRASWREEGQVPSSGLPIIRAWMVFSAPEEAEQILARLQECEADCLERLESRTVKEVPRASWTSRMLSLSWDAVREQVEGEIDWIKDARNEITEFLAESR